MLFFADPWLLWILVPLFVLWLAGFVLVRLVAHSGPMRSSGALRFSTLRSLKRLRPSTTVKLRRAAQALRVATLALLVVAMARPQTGRRHTKVSAEGIDIMLAIDTSGSMRALDLDADRPIARRRNRLEVVKAVVANFVEKRETDQIGVVVFGEDAFTQCPLTLDHGIVSTFLDRVEIGVAGEERTAIGSALGTAVNRLKKSTGKSKVIILLTDGLNNAGSLSPGKAAEVAKAFGIKIHSIGAGTRGQAPFIAQGLFGQQVVYQDVQIDEDALKQIAQTTGGAYFRAEDSDALRSIYEHIDEMEKTEVTMTSYLEYNERFGWLVMPAVGLLLFEVLLLGTRLRKIP